MPTGRRLSRLLLVLALVGAPAVVLRVFCVGNSCDAGQASAQAAVPFCPLPQELRRAVAAGFREGRSPDVMAATAEVASVWTAAPDGIRIPWPGGRASEEFDARVPIAFFGGGVTPGTVPDGTKLDAIAPTLETITGLRRPHPDVRTGEAIDGVAAATGSALPLVVTIAWKGVGTADLEAKPDAWPFLRRALRQGMGTLDALTGSLPLDPAATLTTIGTGGLPSAHGITGAMVREDDGDVRPAWSTPDAGSVIASFADDLDHDTAEQAKIGAVISDPSDRGIIGDGWYLDAGDRDTVAETGRQRAAAPAVASVMVSGGFGGDDVTDVLGVVLDGSVGDLDAETAEVVGTIRSLMPGATFVLAGTGSLRGAGGVDASTLADDAEAALGAPVVAGTAADGLFLDRDVLVERALTAQQVADVLGRQRTSDGGPVFADVYPSFAVAFSRYC